MQEAVAAVESMLYVFFLGVKMLYDIVCIPLHR